MRPRTAWAPPGGAEPESPRPGPAGYAVVALVLVPPVWSVIATLAGLRIGLDSAVYRAGASAVLDGEPLYGALAQTSLPFTYPPASVLAFLPLTAFPPTLAWGVLGALSVAALAWIVRTSVSVATRTAVVPVALTAGLTGAFLLVEPVLRTVSLGQINLLLMALVLADVLVLRRHSGVLIGIASAVKLTPLIFVGHLFCIGRHRDACRALAVFAGLQAAMFLLIPSDALRYWREVVHDVTRVGDIHWSDNQSLHGLLLRVMSDVDTWVLPTLAAALAVPAVWLVRHYHRHGDAMAALLVTAGYGLVVSPVSWTHHWVWCVPLIILVGARARTAWEWIGVGALTTVFGSYVLLFLPGGRAPTVEWSIVDNLLVNSYLYVPPVLLAVLAYRARVRSRAVAG